MSHATRGEHTITTGRHAQDLEAIHGLLTNSTHYARETWPLK
jgi:hypothetical protein